MTHADDRVVSDAVRDSFRRDGVAVVSNAIDPSWLEVLAEAADEIRAAVKVVKTAPDHSMPPGFTALRQTGDYIACENGWTFNEKLKRFAFESGVARIAAEAMASREARLFETLMIYKEQGCDLPTDWHQDLPQHGVSGRQACSVWLSLDPVVEATGALRIAAGSHNGPWYTPPFMPAGREHDRVELEGGPIPDPNADPARFPSIVSYDTRPGDVVLLHPATLHSTRGNPAGARRRSFSIRFIGDDIRRKASRCEWHSWLKELPLKDGDRMEAACFPRLWPR